MKTISMCSALGIALVLGGAMGCNSQSMLPGCGSPANFAANPAPLTTCGYGTVASGGQCVTQSTPVGGGAGGCAAGYTSSNGTCVPSH